MRSELYPFQVEGACFLAPRRRALLADQMGLGKTPQVIRALDVIGDTRPFVVCPAIAVEHWRRQFLQWARRHHRPQIVSYDNLRARLEEYKSERWDAFIVDEAHFAKTMKAKRTKAVWGPDGLAHQCDRLWSVTGTPAPNNYGELYPMLKANGVWLGDYWDFVKRYCRLDEQGEILGSRPERAAELRTLLNPFMIRRMKAEVLPELPPMTLRPYYVKPDPYYIGAVPPFDADVALRDYTLMDRELKQALVCRSAERQLEYLSGHTAHTGTWRRLTGVLKVPGVLEMIQFELEHRLVDKLVVYAIHRDVIDLLWHLLSDAGIPCVKVYGGTSQRRRTSAQDRFARWDRGVFIGQMHAAGTAIDLTSASEGVIIEKDWVPGNNAQAMERMHRIGQTEAVNIRDIVISDSADEVVSASLRAKIRELSALFD